MNCWGDNRVGQASCLSLLYLEKQTSPVPILATFLPILTRADRRDACPTGRVFMRKAVIILATTLFALISTGAETPAPRVYRDRVQPHWFADGAKFWYRVTVASNASEFVLVDAEKGVRRPAFDAARLAKALAEVGVTNATPESLPLDNLEFDAAANEARFRSGSKNWRCNLASYTLAEQPSTNAA